MKLENAPDFKREFPEEFPWGKVSTRSLSELGWIIAARIKGELQKPLTERFLVGGMRESLREIAKAANIDD